MTHQRYSVLDEPLIRYRRAGDGQAVDATLPEIFAAMTGDVIRDFPSLRPHQRHPWHAFLVQLAAIAMHAQGRTDPFQDANLWRDALRALTRDYGDDAPWCLVAPPAGPALLQAAEPTGSIAGWDGPECSPDRIDMLVTAKNHDLKAERMRRGEPQDWLYALVSLQTQEGFLGRGNYGISRMNGGLGSRPGVGVVPAGLWGRRWRRDVAALLEHRPRVVKEHGLCESDGLALVWLRPWGGQEGVSFEALDPYYIEVCRRVRLVDNEAGIGAMRAGSNCYRIAAAVRAGVTGDPWTPIDLVESKALSLTARGFDYRLAVQLLTEAKYAAPITQRLRSEDGEEGLVLLARGLARGQGKTEGYHERRIPLSRTMARQLRRVHLDQIAQVASERVDAIAEMRRVLWGALCTLFENGKGSGKPPDPVKNRANEFARPFEAAEDGRFFGDLALEMEATDPERVREQWLLDIAERAQAVLDKAFEAGPRSAMQRYRARAAARSRFRGVLRSANSPLPTLARLYKQQSESSKRDQANDHN